jgi:PEP-CTERM motif
VKLRTFVLAGLLSLTASLPATATVLTFEGLGLSTFGDIPGTYGDNLPGTPNITVEYFTRNVSNGSINVANLDYWSTDYGDLVDVAFPVCNVGCYGVLTLVPTAGFAVRLNSFDLGGWPDVDHPNSLVAVSNDFGDGSGTILVNYSPANVLGANNMHSSFFPNVLATGPVSIIFGFNDWNVGLDNVNFDQCAVGTAECSQTAPSPEPSTMGLLSLGLAALARRRARRQSR